MEISCDRCHLSGCRCRSCSCPAITGGWDDGWEPDRDCVRGGTWADDDTGCDGGAGCDWRTGRKQDSEETESAEETTKPEEEKKDEEKATDEPQATEEPQYQSAAKQDESDNLPKEEKKAIKKKREAAPVQLEKPTCQVVEQPVGPYTYPMDSTIKVKVEVTPPAGAGYECQWYVSKTANGTGEALVGMEQRQQRIPFRKIPEPVIIISTVWWKVLTITSMI